MNTHSVVPLLNEFFTGNETVRKPFCRNLPWKFTADEDFMTLTQSAFWILSPELFLLASLTFLHKFPDKANDLLKAVGFADNPGKSV